MAIIEAVDSAIQQGNEQFLEASAEVWEAPIAGDVQEGPVLEVIERSSGDTLKAVSSMATREGLQGYDPSWRERLGRTDIPSPGDSSNRTPRYTPKFVWYWGHSA